MSDVEWKHVNVALRDLTPWERNLRRISKKNAERLLDLWQHPGQFQTTAIGPAGEVYDGHQRPSVLKAAFGDDYCVQALRSSRPLTEKEREELVIIEVDEEFVDDAHVHVLSESAECYRRSTAYSAGTV